MSTAAVLEFTPSPQQQAVFDWVSKGRGSAFIEAVAGAGKTTTLIHALRLTTGTVAFAAYNRKIADEIKAKLIAMGLKFDGWKFEGRLVVNTFHGFGYGAWRYVHKTVNNNGKLSPEDAGKEKSQRTRALFRTRNYPEGLDFFALKLISLAKNNAVGLGLDVNDRSVWYDIVDHYDLAYELDSDDPACTVEAGIEAAIEGLKFHISIAKELCDFDDMIFMPVISGIRMWQNDWVFTDEAQDTNRARRALARKMLKPSGRSAWVGDRHQAIYGFAGADNDAIDQIIHDFKCVTLPLTVTYRCPQTVVAEAQTIVNHIEAHPSAPQGEVSTLAFVDFNKLNDFSATDAILCRKTKPLVSAAYSLLRRGIACHVEGKEIGQGLVALVTRWKKIKTIEALRNKLEKFADEECQKLIAKGKETQAEALRDRVDTVIVIMDSVPPATTIDELRNKIKSMFTDSNDEAVPTLTLSTVHKSKGREWPRVFILGRQDFMPSPFARQAWQQEQENNLIYVAITRSQDRLVYINGVPKE